MSGLEKFLHTAKTHTVGGGTGTSRSSDGRLDITFSMAGRPGTNPEQLFAAGWSARFADALQLAARGQNVALPPDLAVDAEVDLWLGNGAYILEGRLSVRLPGLEAGVAQSLVDTAKEMCPQFIAIRNVVDVVIQLV